MVLDPSNATVTPLISLFQMVTTYRRAKTKEPSLFVPGFRGLVAKHLMCANSFSSSQIGEVLAITLLNNANLDSGTLTSTKGAPINYADSRS